MKISCDPEVDAALNPQLRKGVWLQRSFTLSTLNRFFSFILVTSNFADGRHLLL